MRQPLNSYHNMFQSHPGCERPRRIIVQGKAGVGKSTFASKLAYDWANGSKHLENFKMVVLIELKQMKGSLQEAVYHQLFPRDFTISPERLSKYLSSHQDDTLFVLDGYDEARASVLDELRDIASGKLFRNACVLLTSRLGKSSRINKFMDTRVEVTGFTTENVRDYIFKYFQCDRQRAERLIDELEVNPLIEDVAKVPLTAMLICALWEEMPNALATALSTMTSLFTELILLLVKRHYAKNSQESDPELEPFMSLEDIPDELFQDMIKLGEVAMDGLLKDELIFDLKELEKRCSEKSVLELGFLSQETSASRLKPVPKCRFLHKSFQEFFAALWLSNEIKSAATDPERLERVINVFKQCVVEASEVLLIRFVAGLLGEHFGALVPQMIKEMLEVAQDKEAKQEFFVVCILAIFESQQSQLAQLVGSLLQDGVVQLGGREVSPYAVRAMTFFLQNNPGIKSFLLEQSVLGKHAAAIFGSCISQIPSLRELSLNQNTIAYGGVLSFQENLSCKLPLEKFIFRANASRKDIGKDLARIIQCCPNLTHLDLSYNGLGGEEMKHLFRSLPFVPYLKELQLCGNKMNPAAVTALTAQLKHLPQLTYLSVSTNLELGAAGVKILCEVLPHSSQCLRSLSLGRVNFDAETSESSQVIYNSVGQALGSLPNLDHLDLAGNILYAGEFVGECIKKATSLTHLDLSGNFFQDTGAKKLAEVLPNLKCLVELILDQNGITCEGLVALSQIVHSLPHLTTLSLKSNKISDRGVAALSEVLPSARQLENLLLSYNKITDHGLASIIASFKCVPLLKSLSIRGNRLNEEGFQEVALALDSLPNLKMFAVGCPVSGRPVSAILESSDAYCLTDVRENGTLGLVLSLDTRMTTL